MTRLCSMNGPSGNGPPSAIDLWQVFITSSYLQLFEASNFSYRRTPGQSSLSLVRKLRRMLTCARPAMAVGLPVLGNGPRTLIGSGLPTIHRELGESSVRARRVTWPAVNDPTK